MEFPGLNGHLFRRGMNGRAGSPTDDLPGEQVENHGHIEPAFPSFDIGDVDHPDLILVAKSQRFA